MAQGWASRTYPLSRTAMYHRRLWLRNRTPWLKGRLCVTIRMSPHFEKVKSRQKVFSGSTALHPAKAQTRASGPHARRSSAIDSQRPGPLRGCEEIVGLHDCHPEAAGGAEPKAETTEDGEGSQVARSALKSRVSANAAQLEILRRPAPLRASRSTAPAAQDDRPISSHPLSSTRRDSLGTVRWSPATLSECHEITSE
jgi:hypothetical protein